MKIFERCANCSCREPHTKIYQCDNCGKHFCDECKEPLNKCPHCGIEAGMPEVLGEIDSIANLKY